MDEVKEEAIQRAQNAGIVFIDEIDKVAGKSGKSGPAAEIARAGVQVSTSNIAMKSVQDNIDLADAVLSFARKLASG